MNSPKRQHHAYLVTAVIVMVMASAGSAMQGKALYADHWNGDFIYVVDLETGAVDTVFRNNLRSSIGMPNFSPDGTEIGFIVGGNAYYAMKNNGTGIRKICDMGGTKTKGGDWAWTKNGIFWVTKENDVYRADPRTGERWLIHHIDNVNYSNGLWASDDGTRIQVWVKEPHHGVLMEFSSNWTQVTERVTDCWGHGNWMPGDGSCVVVSAWGHTRGQLPDAAHRNFVAYNWSDITVDKAFMSGASGETSVYGLRWCANDRDLIGFETGGGRDFIINWRTEELEEIPVAQAGIRDTEHQPDLGGLWKGELTTPEPGPPRVLIATPEVHYPQANTITRVYLTNSGGGTLDALEAEILEGDEWLNLLFTGPEYQIEPGNTQVLRTQLDTDNTMPAGVHYATVAIFGGGTLDTAYLTVVYNKDMPVYAPGGLRARSFSGVYVGLTWDDRSDDETGFAIERAPVGGTFSEIGSVGADITMFHDSSIESGTYEYRIRAIKGSEHSGYSLPAEVDVAVIPTVRFTNPVGGEVLKPGDTLWIQWETVEIPIAQVQYSTDGGKTYTDISKAGGISPTSAEWENHPWEIPDIEAQEVIVRVQSYQEPEFGANSKLFTISRTALAFGARPPALPMGSHLTKTSMDKGRVKATCVVAPGTTGRVAVCDMRGSLLYSAVLGPGPHSIQCGTGLSRVSYVVRFVNEADGVSESRVVSISR